MEEFLFVEQRLRKDVVKLVLFRTQLNDDQMTEALAEEFQSCVHKLAGAAGVFGFPTVSGMAQTLEQSIIKRRKGPTISDSVVIDLDALLECIAREETESQKTARGLVRVIQTGKGRV